jgi:hypothetical protein
MKQLSFLDTGPIAIMRQNSGQFSDEFLEWLPVNLHIFTAFAQEVFKVIGRGYTHYSSRTIIEFLRHHTAVKEKSGTWKINDHAVPYLARLFDLVYPEKKGIFEYRTAKKSLQK